MGDVSEGLIQPQRREHVRDIRGVRWHDVRPINRHLRIHILARDGRWPSVVNPNSPVNALVS
jgi:hypothetical protein